MPTVDTAVRSPNDSCREGADKVNMWLANGTQVVWVADPTAMTVSIHRVRLAQVLSLHDTIVDEPLLPGFELPLTKILMLP